MSNPFVNKSGEEIADMWQVRALRAAEGKLARILLLIFMHEYVAVTKNTWETLLRIIWKGFTDIKRPFLCGYARIELSGRVTCEMINGAGEKVRVAVYRNKHEYVSEMRKLADKLKLADLDRTEMFGMLGKWIASDLRIGPDGQKLAS